MSVLLGAGRSVSDVLTSGAQGALDPELRAICQDVALLIRNGASLAECLRPYERRFPAIVIPVLDVGEASGTLPDAARRLAENFEQSVGVQRELKVKAFDPVPIFFALCLVCVALDIGPVS